MADTGGVEPTERVVYGVPISLALRGVGFGTLGLGICVVAGSVLLAMDLSRPVTVAVGLLLALGAVLALVVLVVGALRLVGRGPRLVLDADGFLNATGPGVGVRRASWRDVRKVQTDGRFVSVDLAGGKRSLIRTSSLDVGSKELARQLRARLNRGHGYRPVTPPAAAPQQPSDGPATAETQHD
jgi:hypothetical protein